MEAENDWARPVIDPNGVIGHVGLNATIFGNRTMLILLDTGAGYEAGIDASFVPPHFKRLQLQQPWMVSGIGGLAPPVTQIIMLPITLPDGKQVSVLAFVHTQFSPGVLLGVKSLRELGTKLDIPNSVVTMLGNDYPMMFYNGFHPINATYLTNFSKPAVHLNGFHPQPISSVASFYSTLVGSTTRTTTSAENQRTFAGAQREPNAGDQMLSREEAAMNKAMSWNNFMIIEPQNVTIYPPK